MYKMQALATNNTLTTTFTQLNSMRFLGPIRGVLPVGPNGIPAFNTLHNPPGETYQTALSYNYTISQQGIVGNVSCVYDSPTPIVPTLVDTYLLAYNATCPSGVPLTNVTQYPVPYITQYQNTIGAWVCVPSATSSGGTYTIYLMPTIIHSLTNMITLSSVAHDFFLRELSLWLVEAVPVCYTSKHLSSLL
jgi:hypothetical protein